MSNKWVYYFGDKSNAAKGKDGKNLLGGKGQNLSIMTNLGLPIPTGFVITTRACIYAANNKSWPQGLDQQVATSLKNAERISGKTFGDAKNPLLLSVRSGAAISMPGMMDTVLNLGLNDKIVKTFAKNKGERFAYDSMRCVCLVCVCVRFAYDSMRCVCLVCVCVCVCVLSVCVLSA